MKLLTIFLLIAPALLSAASFSVQYWTDEASTGWLAVTCHTTGANRLTLIQPDGSPGSDFVSAIESEIGNKEFYQLPEKQLPVSAWWHRKGAIHNLLEQFKDNQTSARWDEDGESAKLQYTKHIGQDIFQISLTLQKLAQSRILETNDSEVKAYGLRFLAEDNSELEKTLHKQFTRIHRSFDKRMRKYERSNGFTNQPANSIHELRLLEWKPTRCSALVLTRSKRQLAKTSISIESIHLRLDATGHWKSYDPLNVSADRDKLSEAIRKLLNRQEADGDYFATNYPDPLSREARQHYSPLRIGKHLYFLFEPYTVAAGAWGTVIIAPAKYDEREELGLQMSDATCKINPE